MSATAPAPLLGDVDTPRPVRAKSGLVSLQGWCLVPGRDQPPPMRLTAEGFTLPQAARQIRTDVPRLHPGEAAARDSGFLLEGRIPPGVHLARIEAQLPDGSWHLLRTLCLAAEARPFAVGIELPPTDQTVAQRVHVEGWALQPDTSLTSLSLRYGHQDLPCDIGLPRADLPTFYPTSPHAGRTGFKSRHILSAGVGPLRVKARLPDGSARVARTSLRIAIHSDENIGSEIDLAAARIPLPVAADRPAPEPVARTAAPQNILFVLYGSFDSNSALHVAALANELALAGHACVVAVPHDLGSLARLHTPRFEAMLHADAAREVVFPDGRGPHIIHAWTTRENVRLLTVALRQRHGAKVVVHLEDNEQQILSLALQRSWAELERLSIAELDRLVPTDLTHPHRGRDFLATADGVSVITDSLRDFVPAGRPVLLLPPAADARYFYPRPRPEEFRRLLARVPGETFLFYHGNVHAANAAEVRELYAAVLQLNTTGTPVTLLRTGHDDVDFLGDLAREVAPHVIFLGQFRHHHLPSLLALADYFVQPGWDDPFNRYRLPSKLPEFFALGRPVILPRTNLGTQVRHGVDAWVLDRADAAGIADAVTTLRADPALADRLGAGATGVSARHFSWPRSAAALASFYGQLTP